MPWIELHISTSETHANELSDQLVSFGAQAVTFQDAGNQPIYEPTPETPRLWHKTVVIGLFEHDYPLAPVLQFLETQEKEGVVTSLQRVDIPDEDWERRCLDSFKPLLFGKRLWICPSWHTPPDPHAINVNLDPGLAFGTGSHPTTGLCLAWLDEHIHSEELVIDYGCGSGILAIAASKLGAKNVIAVDNDPQALQATQENIARNHIDFKKIITQLPEAPLPYASADILIANILAQPLIQLAPKFADLVKAGGKIVLSGILNTQADDVILAYTPWFEVKNTLSHDQEWVRISGVRK